ncbi:hypothetical protein GGU10DRAFT_388256 [Lentinula aff. detonsa]|uniref:Uncharacterized protein n=1 Tax=Lentinula aff. detonsa TaxID=2804958 RepID=A0AA38NIT8_9AGAR|nr:hypothetical protein GGU10DRAFT_388256 [Lentinula aff. detonsa]
MFLPLTSTSLGNYFLGCHLTVFLFSLYVLRAMFALSTIHMTSNLARGMVAFVSYQEKPFGASIYLKQLWALSNVTKQAAYVTNILIGDSFALYRSYVLLDDISFDCDKRFCKLIVLPICTLIASAGCGYKSVYNLSQLPHSGANAFVQEIYNFRAGLLGLSLATNTLATMLVVVFIARKGYESGSRLPIGEIHVQNPYRKACFSLIQLGIVIPASLIISIILYSLKMNANYIVLDSMSQIAGLASIIVVINNYLPSSYMLKSKSIPRLYIILKKGVMDYDQILFLKAQLGPKPAPRSLDGGCRLSGELL